MKIRDAETGHEQWIDTSSRAVRRAHHDWWVNKQAELNETFTKSNVDKVVGTYRPGLCQGIDEFVCETKLIGK